MLELLQSTMMHLSAKYPNTQGHFAKAALVDLNNFAQ